MHARQSAHGTVATWHCRRTALSPHGMSPDGAVAGGAVAAPPLPLVPGKTTEGSEESNEE